MVDAYSRAHRILKPLQHYSDLSQFDTLPAALMPGPMLVDSEQILGVYTTDADSSEAILFTTAGMYTFNNKSWLKLSYKEIERTILPESKVEVSGFFIVLRNSEKIWLSVKGSKSGRLYDAFEVARFVDRVVSDINQRLNPKDKKGTH